MRSDVRQLSVTMLLALEALYLGKKTTEAAAKLGIAQPSISVYLKQLRDITGDALFIRTSHGLEPTGFCHDYYRRAKEVLDSLETLAGIKNASFDPRQTAAGFSVSVPFIKGKMLFEELCVRLPQNFPLVSTGMINLPEQQGLKHLEDGLVDIYIGLVTEKLEKHFSAVKILKSDLVVLCSDKSPHFKKGRISKADYLETPHIKATASFEPSILDARYKRAGLLQKTLVIVPDIWSEIKLLREKDYLLVIDRSDVEFIGGDKCFKMLKTDFEFPQFDIYAVWHARRDEDPAHKWYRGELARICAKYR